MKIKKLFRFILGLFSALLPRSSSQLKEEACLRSELIAGEHSRRGTVRDPFEHWIDPSQPIESEH